MNKFKELESSFYHYMVNDGGLMPKTSRDYIYRLRFLSSYYTLDKNISSQYIEEIIEKESILRADRKIYNSIKAIADFRSCLRKFLAFIDSNYNNKCAQEIEREIIKINNTINLSNTERDAIVKSRIGQGLFRDKLIKYWGGCAISNYKNPAILMASHIKPWRVSSNFERLDVYNGLLLLPNYDRLFDLGYISFANNGKIIISSLISKDEYLALGINKEIKLNNIDKTHNKYFEYHRDICFIK